MNLTAQYLRERFRVFNSEYFGGLLPEPGFAVSNSRRTMGMFSFKREREGLLRKYKLVKCKITVSEYFEQTADEIDDTLLHEMIHFYIELNNIRDTSVHGQEFRRQMERLNARGHHITVSTPMVGLKAGPRQQGRQRLVLATEDKDGRYYMTVVNPSYRKLLNRQLSMCPDFVRCCWFVSADDFFASFPQVRSLRMRRVTEELFRSHVKD